MTPMDAITSWPTNDDVIAEELRVDTQFRAEWECTAQGRKLALAIVCYRADHLLSQSDLADRLGATQAEVARLELGKVNPPGDTLTRVFAQLGIEFTAECGGAQ